MDIDMKELEAKYRNLPSPNAGITVKYDGKVVAKILISGKDKLINQKIAEMIYVSLNTSVL